MRSTYKKGILLVVICLMLSLLGNSYVYAATETPVDAMMRKGKTGAIAYLQREYPESYAYGYEWILYTKLSADTEVSQVQINAYYNSVVEEIKTWDSIQKPTDVERVALALSVLGKDITNVEGVNLASMIYNSPKLSSGSNELIYALLALDAKQIQIPADATWTREKIIAELLKFQYANGGFGLSDNTNAGVDITAMAIQALAGYKEDKKVYEALEKALSYLKEQQSADGGFGSPEATAQVWIALSAMEIDALDASCGFCNAQKNVVIYMDQFYIENPSGYVHTLGKVKPDSMATMQVLQALVAYDKYQKGEGSYWDLSAQKEDLVKPTSIAFEKEQYVLYATEDMQTKVICSEQTDEIVEYVSKDKKVATVSEDGVVTGVKQGTTTVTATSASGATASVEVIVKTPKVKLSTKKGTLQVKKSTGALKVVEKLDTDKVVKWTSSNKKVVTVNQKGKLTAKKVGKATITVTMKSGAKATCKVTVQKKKVKSTVKFKKKTYQLKVKGTLQTSYKLSNSFDTIKSYKSSNKKVVKVTKNGVLTGVKPGTAKVTVRTKNGAKATVKVVVKK